MSDSIVPNMEKFETGHFGFAAVSLDDLGSTGYTLAVVVCDRSTSTRGFQKPMEAALKASVTALRKHANRESMMLRVLTIDSDCEEQHGFIPVMDLDPDRYNGMLEPRGVTALFDGCINAAQSAANYGKQLLQDRFSANGIMIVITDGANNSGRFSSKADVIEVRKAIEEAVSKECLESFTSILIGVNVDTPEFAQDLAFLHKEGGFSCDLIKLKDASPENIAKIGDFVASSVSSTSASLGTGGPSQSIKF